MAAVALCLPMVGCRVIEGNGVPRNVHRDVAPFSSIELDGSQRVEARRGSPQSVSVSGDENLVDHIETVVNGSRLYVHEQSGVSLHPRLPLIVRVVSPELAAVELSGSGSLVASDLDGGSVSALLSGSGELELSNLSGGMVQASLSGSGDLRLEGWAEEVDIHISGSGRCAADCVQTKVGRVSLSGSGDVDVCVTDRLEAHLSGSGTIRYSCDPRQVDEDVSGSGSVVHR